MYDMTAEQAVAEQALLKQGFKFSNWISAQDEEHPERGCMVFKKRGATRYGSEYREIQPNGEVL